MGFLFNILKIPFINRLTNRLSSTKKTTFTAGTLAGLSILGLISHEHIEALSGLDPMILVPLLLLSVIVYYIPKLVNYFSNKRLNELKIKNQEKKIILDNLQYEVQIKKIRDKLDNNLGDCNDRL